MRLRRFPCYVECKPRAAAGRTLDHDRLIPATMPERPHCWRVCRNPGQVNRQPGIQQLAREMSERSFSGMRELARLEEFRRPKHSKMLEESAAFHEWSHGDVVRAAGDQNVQPPRRF